MAIARRIERMEHGNFGDVKSVATNISELRITTGQSRDIKKAHELLEEYDDEE